jgi:recombinational DNA repair protein (RecF pathway)
MVFEGVVIHKVPYKERDLIVKLMLRNGTLGSFYIYGGQGGGKHHKPTIFELGSMVKIFIREQKSSRVEGQELMIAGESQRLWEPTHVRHNIQAYYLICLYFEIIQKFSIHFQLGTSEYENNEHEGIFSVLSNALFYLNDSLQKELFQSQQHLTLFMIKLLFHIGIMPDTDHCSYCGANLLETPGLSFLPANGQFACSQCVTAENERGFLLRIKKAYQTKYQNYTELAGTNFQEADKLIHFFCHHFHLRPIELKSYKLLMRS